MENGNGLYQLYGWLIPANIPPGQAPQFIQRTKRQERKLAQWLKQQRTNNKKKKAKKKNKKITAIINHHY